MLNGENKDVQQVLMKALEWNSQFLYDKNKPLLSAQQAQQQQELVCTHRPWRKHPWAVEGQQIGAPFRLPTAAKGNRCIVREQKLPC